MDATLQFLETKTHMTSVRSLLRTTCEEEILATTGFAERHESSAVFPLTESRIKIWHRRVRCWTCAVTTSTRTGESFMSSSARHGSVDTQTVDSQMSDLGAAIKKRFRSCVMCAAYLSQDDPGISEAVQSLARHTVEPVYLILQRLTQYFRVSDYFPGVSESKRL